MLRAIRNTWRLLRMALSLARHDALFPLETLGIVPALVAWARLFARPPAVSPPGEEARPGDQRRRDAQRLQREQRVMPREAQRHAQEAPAVAQGPQHA